MIEAIRKALKRTERTLTFARIAMGSVSALDKLVPSTPALVWRSDLNIYFTDGSGLSWHRKPGDESSWREFQRWFHGRPQSTCFVMRHATGCDAFLRSRIKSYSIRRELVDATPKEVHSK